MASITCLRTGVVYRNPAPHVHSVHAYFPSVVALGEGEMLCSLVLGEAFEALNLHTYLARSTDGGETWELEGGIYPGTGARLTSDACRLTALGGGEVVAFMVRHDRSAHPHEGLANPATLGFVPTELLLLRSADGGRTWSAPSPLMPPLVGPAFELCAPVTPLRDGRWLLPTSTWRGWDGECPNGMKMVALVSPDRGRTWPHYVDVLRDPEGRVIYWESKIAELPDGRLLAVAWAYDEPAAADRPNAYALSADGGRTWSTPAATGLAGQTLTPVVLEDGRLLCVYRRMDRPGLWANLSHLEGDAWVNGECLPLWGADAGGLTGASTSMVQNFQVLRFGAPSLARLDGGEVFVAFWCYEDCVSVVRWFRVKVD
ncbi:MAG: sialidase family protein [Candidatus Latescibacterota bacterium]